MQHSPPITEHADVRLAQKAHTDVATAERILHRVQPRIHHVVRSLVRSSQYAEEIGQTVSMEVFKSLPKYRGHATLESWAGGVAYKVTMKMITKERKWHHLHVCNEDLTTGHLDTPEVFASRQQLLDLLQEKLSIIPENRRTPLLLHLLHGYTVDEVSQMLNTSPNTIKDRLKTALREMRLVFDRNPTLKQALLEEIR